MSWKEFEAFSHRIFESSGFETRKNFRLRKPSAEIDILAIRVDFAFAIDCKHWKRTVGNASMTKIAERQIARAMRLLQLGELQKVAPMILTWRDEMLYLLANRVPVVPIRRLPDFLLNYEASMTPILTISSSDRQQRLL